ncbi:hypothetical protein OH687_19135 [Burkholderia anthina]|nr:hypothetical protein OH687_19135 [Burkholderia anthina]
MHPAAPAPLFAMRAAGVVAPIAPAWLAAGWRRRTLVPWRSRCRRCGRASRDGCGL